ncbi:uncharacterized protein B0H64DRAFT_132777 [Chaetomium fimeti]|uniref:Uncharacterized protein n=1 Tax=Chaetomium fimeti TaxID=1854472 RepID=A0AAE0LUD5_9PEZI|nr:hypothetical protein B0H64DRAFT_132777 [Chaetomium fimeti]
MAMTMTDGGHLALYPRCSICAYKVSRHERVIALFGNHDSTSYRGHTRPFPFPRAGGIITRVNGRELCRYPDCKRCAVSPEFTLSHHDCFEVFRQQCSVSASVALDRLWILTTWKKPWDGAQPRHFPIPMVDRDTLRTISRFCGLPHLYTLPLELLEMIRQHTKDSFVWRCIPVVQLADCASALNPEPLFTFPLRDILSWERGGKLERVMETWSPSPPPILRLTVDPLGISKVERLPDPPRYTGECASHLAFIVEDGTFIPEAVAQFKYGRLRLGLPVWLRTIPIWNTPTPPSLALCKAYPNDLTSCHIFHTVEMDKIKGITFFFSGGKLFGINVHHSDKSCAIDTFATLPGRLRWGIVWIYLPISQHDPVLVLGIRETERFQNVLVRTALMGDIIVASKFATRRVVKDRCLAISAPVTMVYSEPKEGRPIRFFGSRCAPPLDQPRPAPFLLEDPGFWPVFGDAYFSWAPLSGVSSTVVFYDQDTGFCRGILFHYLNGGVRAVGQCRLGVDPTENVARPVQLCYRRDSPAVGPSGVTQVEFTQHDIQTHREGWEFRSMRGVVKFWFTTTSSYLVVQDCDD